MRAYVFTDPSLARHAGRFVWLEIDTEKAKNAAFRKQYPVPALPSYFVLDAQNEKAAIRWVGGATVAQLHRLLDEGNAAVARRHAAPGSVDALLARADSLYGAGQDSAAARAYEGAIAAAPADWPSYSRAVESLLFDYSMLDDNRRCAALAQAALPRLKGSPSAANVAASGLGCAVQLDSTVAGRAELVRQLEEASRALASDTTLGLSGDDRSGVYIALLDARQAAGDSVGARRVAEEWVSFLESAAARARTPDARAVYDSHRLSAYIELGQPERAIPMLEASECDLPDDYNPPARLATAYKAMKRWDDALAASDRAMAKAYGPRKLLIYSTRADIFAGRGDKAGARRTVEEAITFAEAMPPGQRSQRSIDGLKKKLVGLN